jgi:hydroxyacylglutathione hydrolase
MKVEQLYTKCLAQGAYYISSNGEAAIIDPLRETQPYLNLLAADSTELKYIFETHFHADFVSGHVDLAAKTGAKIVYGPNANPSFDALIATDNQEFMIGDIKIKAIHTPGHTMESTCYLLIDSEGKETALFSGDTLFLGDVGRPDLAQKAANMTQEELAGSLYDSLYTKILPLSDEITVYPGHGAGSACGKNMMKETVDTLGNQKKINYALNQPNKESFVAAVTDGLLPPPAYFGMNVAMNKQGYEQFDVVLEKGLTELSLEAFENIIEDENVLVLDARGDKDFHLGFVPGSINIGLGGDFAPWVGALIKDVNHSLVLITEPGKEEEAIIRLSRVGFDKIQGYLQGGFDTWKNAGKAVETIHRIDANQFEVSLNPGESTVIDVRKETEYEAEHVADAYSKPLAYIYEWVDTIDKEAHFFLHCAGGYRSMIAASILKAKGVKNFTEVAGGFNAISKTNVPKTDFVCQSKVLK